VFATLTSDLREMAGEQIQFRELLYQMTLRDLLLRYKQAVMGFGWAILMPLVNTLVFSVIFTRIAPLDTGVPYPLFAYCGLLVWNFSASSFRFSVNSLTANANLVTKVYFPREIFPISATLVSLVDFAVGSLVLVALMVYYRIPPSWALVALPAIMLVQIMFTVGISLLLAMANLFYRDVKYLFEIVITMWMFATSVVYPVTMVGGKLSRVLALNPMTPIIEAYRDILLKGQLPHPAVFGWAFVAAAVTLVLAWLAFHRAEFTFAENI
jgi:lipopolysaccharide transport system permease protein